jgi:PrtD family type I secretion system ABC transporter
MLTILSSLRSALLGIGLTSSIINILALTGSFFMLQVYDRVIPGRSLPTLAGLIIIAATLFAFLGVLELIRLRLLAQVGLSVDERLGKTVFRSLTSAPSRARLAPTGLQPIRDMDDVRGFLSGPGPAALFDLPWIPFYLFLCFLFHLWIGVTALAGALLLIALAILADVTSRKSAREAAKFAAERLAFAEAAKRNSDAAAAMGFGHRLAARWARINDRFLANHLRATNITGSLSTFSRVVRMMLQSAVLAVGAILVIRQEASGGIMIASSILASRALAPLELAIGHWRGFVAARQSWLRLLTLDAAMAVKGPEVALSRPKELVSVENLHLAAPGSKAPIIRNVSFEARAGEAIGIIGPSASGKSSLARAIVGLWQPLGGNVRLDRACLMQWDEAELGRHIGYLPQEASLFQGSIAENIARFDPDASSKGVIEAARRAGVYEMIVRFPDGFDTEIGEQGAALSAGQRQRIALARALYGDPFLVVLDEPNANLDAEGDAALARAVSGIKARGAIALVIAHRPSALAAVDKVLVLAGGQVQAFGPKDKVLKPTPAQAAGTAVRLLRAGAEAAE